MPSARCHGMHQSMVDAGPLYTDRLTGGARGRTTTGQPALRPQRRVVRRSKLRQVINEEHLHEVRQFLRQERLAR